MAIWHLYRVVDDSTCPVVVIEREALVGTYDCLEDAQHMANQYAGDKMRIREMPERRARGYRIRGKK